MPRGWALTPPAREILADAVDELAEISKTVVSRAVDTVMDPIAEKGVRLIGDGAQLAEEGVKLAEKSIQRAGAAVKIAEGTLRKVLGTAKEDPKKDDPKKDDPK